MTIYINIKTHAGDGWKPDLISAWIIATLADQGFKASEVKVEVIPTRPVIGDVLTAVR